MARLTRAKSDESATEIQKRMQAETRQIVLLEMRNAAQLAALAGCGTEQLHDELNQWKTAGRIFSVQDGGTEYFPWFALDRGAGYRPYPVVADVIRIMSEVIDCGSGFMLAAWFISMNSYLDEQRPADLLASAPEWVIEAARDWVDTMKYPCA